MFIYPDNLKAKATLWLWELRDVAIIGVGFLFSVLAIAQTGILLPLVVTVLYAFLSIRLEGSSNIRSHGDRSCPLLQSPVNEDLFTIRILNEHRRNWS